MNTVPVHCSYEQETDKCSKLEMLDNLNYGMALDDKLGVLDQNIVYRSYESLVLCYNSHFIKSSCYHNCLHGHQAVTNDAAKEFSTML